MWAAFSSFTFLSANQCHRFVENIPQHISPKSGFESFAEYTQCVMGGSVRLEATRDISAGEEVYVRHAPGDVQWECFHPEHCTSSKCKYFVFSLFLWEGNVCFVCCFCTCSESLRFSPLCAMRPVLQGHPHCLYCELRQYKNINLFSLLGICATNHLYRVW